MEDFRLELDPSKDFGHLMAEQGKSWLELELVGDFGRTSITSVT